MTWARTLGKRHADGRRNNGGARPGAGRPISNEYRKLLDKYLKEKVLVKEFRHGQMRLVKKPVLTAILDKLAKQALRDHDVRAARLYLDVTLGKPFDDKRKSRYRPKAVVKAIAETGMIKK